MKRGVVELLNELPLWSAPFGGMLLDAVPYHSGQRVLDIGFGAGFPLLELAQRIDRSTVVGVDPWPEACTYVKHVCELKQIRNVNVHCTKAETLPLQTKSVDLIVSNNGLNNVEDLDAVLRECRRVIVPSGRIVATINLPGSMKEFYDVFRSVLRSEKIVDADAKIDRHIRSKRMKKSEFVRHFKEAGFVVERLQQRSFALRFSNGTALLNHCFVKLAFLPVWSELIPLQMRKSVLKRLEIELNETSTDGLALTIPMLCLTAVPATRKENKE